MSGVPISPFGELAAMAGMKAMAGMNGVMPPKKDLKGYFASLGIGDFNSPFQYSKFAQGPKPESQWAYVPGQGTVWQTPEATADNWQMKNNRPGEQGFYGGGNRI